MYRCPKAAFTTVKGCSGEVYAIRWLPSLLPRRVVLAVHPRRDFRACLAYYIFPLNVRRPTLPYSGEMSNTFVHSGQPQMVWWYCQPHGSNRVLLDLPFMEFDKGTPLKSLFARCGRS